MTMLQRVMARTEKMPDGCWLWTGGRTGRGYGSIGSGGLTLGVHRVAYEATVGPIPEGMTIDHLCRVKVCVNPDHMEVVTVSENVRRQHAAITHCPQGHLHAPENNSGGDVRRKCRECHNARRRKPGGYGPRNA